MKDYKLLKYIIVIFLAMVITSCEDGFLEEKPTAFLDPNALLVDTDGAEIYLFGAYDAIQHTMSYGGQGQEGIQFLWGITASDLGVAPRWDQRRFIYLHQQTPGTPQLEKLWKNMYSSVNRVNSTIDRIGEMTADQIESEDKSKFIAEAKYLRSMLYFGLVVAWENIPLRKNETTELDNLDIVASPPEEVYNFIVEDLQFAIATLPVEQGSGRATKGAAQALLGKVYLQMAGFPLNQTDKLVEARDLLKEVMDSGVYNLLPNYRDIFTLDNEQSSEMVFAIGMEGAGLSNGGNVGSLFGPRGSRPNGGGFPSVLFNLNFVNTYDEDGDWRFKNNVSKHNANTVGPDEAYESETTPGQANNPLAWRPWKWHAAKPNAYTGDTPFDYPYIRYADVLLMYAEALNELGELTQEDLDITVNRLRNRARRLPDALPNILLGSQEDNDAAILSERAKELCFEGWRRTDLTRRGIEFYRSSIFADQKGVNAGNPQPQFEDHEIRWPIPQVELNLNSLLEQNPGY